MVGREDLDAASPSSANAIIGSMATGERENSAVSSCRIHNDDELERRLMDRIEQEDHTDEHHAEEKKDNANSKKVMVMITITFLFFLVELVVGFINGSIALLADSYHMLSDVMALTIALICLKISRRKSKRNGFGWVRAEVLGALVNGVFLLAMCFTISLESIGRFIHAHGMKHPFQVLIVGVIGLLINLVGITMFHGAGHGHSHGGGDGGHGHSHDSGKKKKENGHGHSHDREDRHSHSHDGSHGSNEESDDLENSNKPIRSSSHIGGDCSHNHLALKLVNLDENIDVDKEEFTENGDTERKQRKQKAAENLNMRGVFLHIVSDAIGSVFVIITACLAHFFPVYLKDYNPYLDPALSLVLVCLISYSAYALVRETSSIVLRRTPVFVDYDDIKADIMKVKGVAEVMNVHVWTLVGDRHIATAEVRFCSAAAFDVAAPKIRKVFHTERIHSLTLQPVFSGQNCSTVALEPLSKDTHDHHEPSSPLLAKE